MLIDEDYILLSEMLGSKRKQGELSGTLMREAAEPRMITTRQGFEALRRETHDLAE